MNKNYRQGDISYIGTNVLPKLDTKPIEQGTIFSGGTGGHNHDFKGGKFYAIEDGNTIGYLEAKNTTLLHPEHGEGEAAIKTAQIEDGVYKVIRQVEQAHEGMVPVID